MTIEKVIVLQPPSPPFMNVKRDYAGGFGVADPSVRNTFGHDPNYITLPFMSALYTAAVLEKEKYEVRFIDAQAEALSLENMLIKIKDFSPQVIISVINLPSIYGDLRVLRTIKESMPDVKIITIGVVNRVLKDLILKSGSVDFAVQGDPEVIVPNLLKNLDFPEDVEGISYIEREEIITTPGIPRITDLDSLPYPAYHLAPMEKYWYHVFGKNRKFASVFSSKGCDF